MKKWLIGCGISLFILIVLCGGGVLYSVYKLGQVAAGFEKSTAQVKVLNAKYPFTMPDEGGADAERLEQYFAIRKAVAEKLYSNNAFVGLTKELSGERAGNVGVGEIMSMMFTFSREMIDFFGTQLDAHKMSPEEYIYLSEASYSVIAAGNAKGEEDFKKVHDEMKAASDRLSKEMQKNNQARNAVDFDAFMEEFSDQESYPVTAEMVTAVRGQMDQLGKYPHLAFFELLIIQNQYNFSGVPAFVPAGVVVPTPVPGSASAQDTGAQEGSSSVVLKSVGQNKIAVIKEVRAISGLGLAEAKDLVDNAPKPVIEGVSEEDAAKYKKQLEDAGAVAEVE